MAIPLIPGRALVGEYRPGLGDAVRGFQRAQLGAQQRQLTAERLRDIGEAREMRADERAIDRQLADYASTLDTSDPLAMARGMGAESLRLGRFGPGLQMLTQAANLERAQRQEARDAQRFALAQGDRAAKKARAAEDEAILAGLYEKYGLDPQTARVLGSEPIKKRIEAAQGPILTVQEQQKLGEGARSEVRSLPSFKNYSAAAPLYEAAQSAVKRAATDVSGISDVDLVFAVAKMFDPNSVVREGEFVTVEQAQSLPARIRNAIERANTGRRLGRAGLTQGVRQDMLNAARDRLKSYRKQYTREVTPIRDSLTRLKMNPDEYLYGIPEIATPEPSPNAPAPAPSGPSATAPVFAQEGDIVRMPDGSRQILRGGEWMPYGQAAAPDVIVEVP